MTERVYAQSSRGSVISRIFYFNPSAHFWMALPTILPRRARDQFAWPAVTQNAASSFPALQKLSRGGLDTTLRLVLECVIAGASTPGNCETGLGTVR